MDQVDTMILTPHTPGDQSEVGRKGAKSSTEKRKPVRRDPEKRRQQNIQAQKKYREKLRKKLDSLEALAATVANSQAGVSVNTPQVVPPTAITGRQDSPNSALQQDPCLSLSRKSDTFNFWLSDATAFDLDSNPSTESSGLELSEWDPTTSIDPSRLIVDKHRDTVAPCWVTEYVDCGCPIRHVQVRWSGPPKNPNYQLIAIGPTLAMADPYMNSLRIDRVCCVDAIWTNCLQLGLDRDKFCGEDAISPFCRPTRWGLDSNAIDNMVRTVQSMFKTLKPDLRPTKEQVLIRHPPWFDVLPFPTFRNNIIKDQHMVDSEALFQDLMDGIICWGGAGVGRRDRDCSTGHTSTGTPWDSRSWEAKPWFLKKHWKLLGGEDGELVRQSEWWRNMRGDETDPLLVF